MHRAAIAENVASALENGRIQNDNERLREANQGLHLDNERFRSMIRQLHEDIRGLREDLQYRGAANCQAGTRLQIVCYTSHYAEGVLQKNGT